MQRFKRSSHSAIFSFLLFCFLALNARAQVSAQSPSQGADESVQSISPDLRSRPDLFSSIDRIAAGPDPAVPATPEMRYSIGSISKQFTATAILLPQDQKKISIDDPVGKYVPGLTRGNEVTIRIDRALLAPNLNDYFTSEAIADFQSSLGPLGEPLSLRQIGEELRGGMTFRAFDIVYAGRRLRLTTYTYPDGKLEQYIVAPEQ